MTKKDAERNFIKLKQGVTNFDFGRIVAEQDAQLQDYYVEPERYVARALDFQDPAVFFVGPKGIGKSAILQMVRLVREADSSRVINVSPDDLAFSALANVNANTPILSDIDKNQWLFKSLWDYILSLEVLRREYRDRNTLASALKKIVQFFFGNQHEAEAKRLLDISLGDEGHQQSLSTRILQLVKEVELAAEVKEVGKVAGKAKMDDAKGGQGKQLWLLSLINSVAKKISATVTAPYHILIDDLDLHWHDTPVQNAFIAALFFSLRNFSKPPNMKCAVAIRDQIFRRLPLVDRDKYHDWVSYVEWEADSVKKMVEQRIMYRLNIAPKDIWGGLFQPNAFEKMWRHSYGRPREAIRLISLTIQEARRNGHRRVKEEDLMAGIRKFSDVRITEMASEFSHRYRGLEPIIRKFTGWPKEFSLDKFSEIPEEIAIEIECKDELANQYTWAGGYLENPKGLARILLECGILLYKASRTDEPVPYDLDKQQEIGNSTFFAIHPVFGPALGLVGT